MDISTAGNVCKIDVNIDDVLYLYDLLSRDIRKLEQSERHLSQMYDWTSDDERIEKYSQKLAITKSKLMIARQLRDHLGLKVYLEDMLHKCYE